MKRMSKKAVMMLFIVFSAIIYPTLRAGASSPDFQVLQTFWGSVNNPLEVGPGDRAVPFNVIVQNIGKQAYSGLDALLYLDHPFSTVMGENIAHGYYAGSIPVGQTVTLQFQLNIDASASIGSYSMIMSLRYGSGFAFGETLTVPILLLGRVELKVSVNPPSLLPGSINRLMINVSNEGTGHASKVSVTLNFPTGLSIIGGGDNYWNLQSIAPNEAKTIIVDASAQSSLAGSLSQIGASITYTDAYGTSRAVSRTIGIRVLPITNVPLAVAVKESDLLPGTVNTLTLSILNNDTKPVSFVQATLTIPSGLGGILGEDNSWFFPSIDASESVTFSAKLMVSSSAAGLNYQLTLTLSYLDSFGITHTESHVFGVQVLPASESVLLVSVAQNVLTSEMMNELKIIISNVGEQTVSSLSVALSTPSPIVVSAGDNRWNFESVNPHENVTFTAMLFAPKTAAGNSYEIQLSLSYKDYLGNLHVETRVIGLVVRAWTTPIIVSVTKSILTAGSNNEPTITIANSGKAPINSITINLSFITAAAATAAAADIILPAGNQWHFDLLLPNKNITFSPTIFAALKSMDYSYQAQLSISYVDEYGISHVETRSLGFSVRGAINFEVFNGEVIPKSTVAGGNVTVTGDLINTGNTRALYTTVMVKPSPIFISTEGSIYLGEISVNAPLPISISVGVSRTAANGTYPLTLVFTYRDDYNETYTIEKNFDVIVGGPLATPQRPTTTTTPRETPAQVSIFQMIPYIIIAIVAVFLVFMVYRRRRRSRR